MAKSTIIGLQSETHVHVGIGQSTGALDLPVARERTTHYPFIPGSGVKGAFRVWASERAGLNGKVSDLFGSEGADEGGEGFAGHLLCSDARLLCLPVRAVSDAFKWVTCPDLLHRYFKDCERAGTKSGVSIPSVADGQYLGQGKEGDYLGLEEREFEFSGKVDDALVGKLKDLYGDDRLADKLVILSDTDFVWFARFALPILSRNSLDENKRVKQGQLWQEESMAPETLMYLLFGERKPGAIDTFNAGASKAGYVQMGGNETIGQGWFKMTNVGGAT